MISKLNKIHGTKKIKQRITGNKIIQQNSINWSNLILGKLALTHIKIKMSMEDLNPKLKPWNIPSINS